MNLSSSTPVVRRKSPNITPAPSSRRVSLFSENGTFAGHMEDPSTSREESRVFSFTAAELKELMKETLQEHNKEMDHKTLKKDLKVDTTVKNGIHSAVTHLTQEDKTWDFTVGFREGRNPLHTREVLTTLGNLIGNFNRDVALKGCRTYFHTLKTTYRKTKDNKMEESRKRQRKRQRKTTSRIRRKNAVVNSKTIQPEDRQRLLSVLQNNDFISSEESEYEDQSQSDDSDTEQAKHLLKTTLPWRSDYLNSWFKTLDKKSKRRVENNQKGGGVSKPRIVNGRQSSRDEPFDAPSYTVQEFQEA